MIGLISFSDRYARSFPPGFIPVLAAPHPLAPVVVVDLAGFCLNLLQKKITSSIITSIVSSHSVLGTTPEPLNVTGRITLEVVLLTKPIVWCTHLLKLCLYASAMVTIFILISMFSAKQQPSLDSIISSLRQSFSRLFVFSLKTLISIGIAAIVAFLSVFLFLQTHGTRLMSTRNFGYVLASLLFPAIAYVMAPAAINLLRPHGSEILPAEIVRNARLSAVLTVLASIALYFLTLQIEPSFISGSTPYGGTPLFEAIASTISAVPYIVLFIALSLLAKADEPSAELLGVEAN